MSVWKLLSIAIVLVSLFASEGAHARRKRRRHYGPPPTHPVVLWSRTLSESTDHEQRKVAAFKLSQYSQLIYQDEVVRTLLKCIKDPDTEIKVLCAKATGRAGGQSKSEMVRKALLEQYQNDPSLRNTIVRAFQTRQDDNSAVQDVFLNSFKTSKDVDEQLALLKYFEAFWFGK